MQVFLLDNRQDQISRQLLLILHKMNQAIKNNSSVKVCQLVVHLFSHLNNKGNCSSGDSSNKNKKMTKKLISKHKDKTAVMIQQMIKIS